MVIQRTCGRLYLKPEWKKSQARSLNAFGIFQTIIFKIFWYLQSFKLFFPISVAIQAYIVEVFNEQVIFGNDVLLKCNIPSFQADFVSVESWVDSEGVSIQKSELFHGNFQDMQLLG